jgi:diguanylate cyclase (GGDEF)-like protein
MQSMLPPLPECPLGKEDCPVLAEVLHLREECRRLRQLSQTDPLTGLYNRRALMQALEQEMERTRRTGLPTSLIMMDLDHFKQLNDTYGHQYGDEVLRRLGAFLRKNMRRLDIPCRYGGEEFALVLPGTRLPQAVRLAERLRKAMNSSRPGQPTASFGVAAYNGKEELTPSAFLSRADHLLLQAKSRGRNRVCDADSLGGPTVRGLSPDERAALFGGSGAAADTGESHG